MGENGTTWLPEAASTIAPEVDALFYFVLWTSVVMFIGVVVAMAYYGMKFRRRDPSYVPPAHHESRLIETASIVIPTILVLIVFTWGFKVFIKMYAAPPDSYEITVRGKQWFWEYEYDNGVVVANEFYVPIGRPVKLNMSATDVLHSYFIPDFRVKHDVLPNRYTSLWFQVDEAGEYQVYCTEYCGTQHSAMLSTLVAVPQAEFDSWLANQNQDLPPAELGELLYTQYACNACHSTDGVAGVGPTFQGLYEAARPLADGSTVTADDNYLRQSILDPASQLVQGYGPVMPATYTSFSAKQLDGLIAYIKALQ
ncbi:MAG: cytochrome c oxidase subunit II [Rhodothermales bacterium]|nr:cytochrome c oxidase subunit II [Rhodothermales bacterium]MBO6779168.1 cytochrome c oxidase subunit II [Rhodothermales bacterium]